MAHIIRRYLGSQRHAFLNLSSLSQRLKPCALVGHLGLPIHKPCGGFPKIRGTNLGVPRTRIPAILGNDHIPYTYPSRPLDPQEKAQGSG